jgi:hypothetical protein
MKKIIYSPLFWLAVILLGIVLVTINGPQEKTLGVNVRIVYLHGAWVWAALGAFIAAALVGLSGLVLRRTSLHYWSRSLGRTGLFFWLTYLPLSMWAMQANWNGLFLAEPRWRLAVVFSIGGILLQIGLALLEDPAWASAGNIIYVLALFLALQNTENVMHPPSPILDSDAVRIQLFFAGLLVLVFLAVWQTARLLRQLDLAYAEKSRASVR